MPSLLQCSLDTMASSFAGIPRGLGAPEFKLKERDRDKPKDKDKDKEREKDREDLLDHSHSRQQLLLEVGDGKDAEEKEKLPRERPRSAHRFTIHRDHSQHRISRDDLANSGAVSVHSDHTHHAPYGWSAMLEDWYVNGGNHDPASDQMTPRRPLLDVPIGDESHRESEEFPISPKAKSTGDLNARVDARTNYRGPYELLIKERMMGLYLAVFIHRDIKGLVRGTVINQTPLNSP